MSYFSTYRCTSYFNPPGKYEYGCDEGCSLRFYPDATSINKFPRLKEHADAGIYLDFSNYDVSKKIFNIKDDGTNRENMEKNPPGIATIIISDYVASFFVGTDDIGRSTLYIKNKAKLIQVIKQQEIK